MKSTNVGGDGAEQPALPAEIYRPQLPGAVLVPAEAPQSPYVAQKSPGPVRESAANQGSGPFASWTGPQVEAVRAWAQLELDRLVKSRQSQNNSHLSEVRSGQPLATELDASADQPWPYTRPLKRISKTLLCIYLMHGCIFGQPEKLVKGLWGLGVVTPLVLMKNGLVTIYQGFNCGWHSHVDDPVTCDGAKGTARMKGASND